MHRQYMWPPVRAKYAEVMLLAIAWSGGCLYACAQRIGATGHGLGGGGGWGGGTTRTDLCYVSGVERRHKSDDFRAQR
jgi:hypothetical protein